MKNTLTISIFLMVSLCVVTKAQDTTHVRTIDIIAPSNVTEEKPTLLMVDVNAKFQDGDLEKFREWVQKNLVYPPFAVENGIQGRVIIQFYINSKGKLVESSILRGVDPSLDNEVLRVVNSSPDWEPALVDDRPVKQQFTMPVIFGLVSKKKN